MNYKLKQHTLDSSEGWTFAHGDEILFTVFVSVIVCTPR